MEEEEKLQFSMILGRRKRKRNTTDAARVYNQNRSLARWGDKKAAAGSIALCLQLEGDPIVIPPTPPPPPPPTRYYMAGEVPHVNPILGQTTRFKFATKMSGFYRFLKMEIYLTLCASNTCVKLARIR